MKFARKSIVSMVIAMSMLMFASVPAYAVDYGTDPGYSEPDNPVTDGSTPDNPTEVVSDSTISDALENAGAGETVTVYVDEDNVLFTEDAIAALAAAGDDAENIVFDAGDYTFTVSNITDIQAIDLSMDIEATDGEQTIETDSGVEVTIPENSLVITPAASGSFGMDITMTFDKSLTSGINAKNANLYYVNDAGNAKKQNSAVKANKNGSISVTINHASFYVLTDQEMAENANGSVDGATSSGDDANPGTGVALAVIPAALATAAAVAAFKKKM